MQGFRQQQNGLLWERNHETVQIEPWGHDSLRVRSTISAGIRDDLLSVLLPPAETETQITIGAEGATIRNGAMSASVSPEGCIRFSNTADGTELLAEESPVHATRLPPRSFKAVHSELFHLEVRFRAYNNERLYGLGQHQHGRLDQKGCTLDLIQRNTEISIPFLFSSRGYGFLWHNPGIGRVELGYNTTRWVAEATPQLDYWITAGATPAEIMEHYADATGHAPEFPAWAAGFWQSKLRYRTQDELLSVAREYKRRGLPLAVMVIDFFHWTLQGDWRFDPELWPDPAGMVRELEQMGVKLMVSIWPTINPLSANLPIMQQRGLLIRTERGLPALMVFNDNRPEGPVYLHYYDSTNPEARQFMWEQVREHYYRYGIKVWWLDACEPEMFPMDPDNLRFHLGNGLAVANAYPLLHERGFYEGMRQAGESAILNLCRSAWAGSQRYGAAVWSGDINSTFEALRAQVRAGLNMGLSGIPWWTTDIGGFYGGDPESPAFRELLIRWFQYSTFCPLFRLHGNRLVASEGSTMVSGGGPNEAWSFGEEAYAIITDLLFLRERLRPYILEQMHLAHEKGIPPMRPLFFDFPRDEACASIDDEFLFGPDLLVAPVLTEGARGREVYLPVGTSWSDAWSGQNFEGGQHLVAEAPLERIPLYLRANARLPIRETYQVSTPGNDVSGVVIADVRFEHHSNPLGVGELRPRLSWMVETNVVGWRQAGYEIEAYGSDGRLFGRTDRVESGQSVLVPWPFPPLLSRERLTVRVRVWGVDAHLSAWSALYPVEAGLLQADDWSAQFITPAWAEDISRPQPCPLVRCEFDVHPGVTRARLYVTALGVYEAQLNGATVGDHVLDPGWTSYNHRLRYQTFDVTSLLREGHNAIGAILGDGWYRGRFGFDGGRRNIYGDRLALLAQLEINYANGAAERIVTDETWRATRGPILSSDIYDGETYDARRERSGWSTTGYEDDDWVGVRALDRDFTTLVAPSGPPVRRIELLEPVTITTSPLGRTIVDFGQNLVGWLRITVRGQEGQTVTLRHAEILEGGELCTRPLRTARSTDRYTLRGDGVETWEPRFTFHGFRYAEVVGWPGTLQEEDIRAVVCHSDLERTGWFECSDPLINRLHENVVWSMRGNFLDVPTDCPQRDERLGWTGDILAFAPTACFLYDSSGFLTSWLADLAAEQTAEGVIPFVVPNILPMSPLPAAAWGDAAVIVPWVLYQRYGDEGILAAQFESMCGWVDLVTALSGEKRLWDRGFQFGDWLDPSAPADRPGAGPTNPHVVATAYYARSAEVLGQIAAVLGRAEDATRYLRLAAEVREAFDTEYVTPAGRVLSDSETAYALALQFGLLQDARQRRRAGERLAALVRNSGYHISTGYVGTPLICDALCSVGEYDITFHLLKQQDCPAWLYPVTMGATTIWERWDSLRPDGSVNPGEMTSFNHYALGAIADWLHRTVAGLAPAAPAYSHITIRPYPGGGITRARARHITPYGPAESRWAIKGEQIEVEVVVPPNATASVALPGGDAQPIEVGAGTHRWSYPYRFERVLQPLSLDNTISEFIDDPEAWTTVLTTMRQHMPQLSGHLDVGSIMQRNRSMTLGETLSLLPHTTQLRAALEDALAKLGR